MSRAFAALVLVSIQILVPVAWTKGQEAPPTAPRLRAGAAVPLSPPLVIGGGEVVLDLTISRSGAVTRVTPVRATPPYTDLLTTAAKGWRFDAAQETRDGETAPAEGHVLILAVYRPPQVYAGPALGAETKQVGQVSPGLPQPGILAMPAAYPPRATRDGAVLIEIELDGTGAALTHRVMSPASPFDAPALEAVRTWRLAPPAKPSRAEKLYVYAIVGFKEPITQ